MPWYITILLDQRRVTHIYMQFSQVTSNIIEAIVSVKRLTEFLRAEELKEDAVKRIDKPTLSIGDEVLSIRDGEFQWSKNGIKPDRKSVV